MNEYVIIAGNMAANNLVIYYCPSCGGRMRKPRLGKFFTMPSDDELAEARSLLEQITDVTTMRSVLGEPNDVNEWYKDEHGEPVRNPELSAFRQQYTYSSRWKTLRLVVQEFEDGQLRYYFYAQPKALGMLGSISSLLNESLSVI